MIVVARSVGIIGAGQIGYALAREFLGNGWKVSIHSRTRPDWPHLARHWRGYDKTTDPAPIGDCVVDTIAFDGEDIHRYDPDKVGHLVAISSASVYCDAQGRTLDEGPTRGYPVFDGAITEEQATVAPGPATYSTRKVQMENKAIERFGDRATILRPCAIYGPWSRHPREWWFVKRMLDKRDAIPLLFDGQSRFQTTNVDLIARLAQTAAQRGFGGVYNIADVDSPNVREIGQAIAQILGESIRFIDAGSEGLIGRSPWSVPRPFVIDGQKAAKLGDIRPQTYTDHLPACIDWLVQRNPADWRTSFRQLAAYPYDLFDYDAEDRFFASLEKAGIVP